MVAGKEAVLGLLGIASLTIGCAGPPRSSALPPELQQRMLMQAEPLTPIAAEPARIRSETPPAATVRQAAAATTTEPSPRPVRAAVTSETAAPAAVALPDNPHDRLRALYRMAAERYAAVDSYIARVHRREQVNGKAKPEEVFLFRYRKQPLSVYFKWIGTEGHGREVVFVQGQHGNKIHTLLAAGDMPLAPAGQRLALAPDSIFVRNASRHSITDAGIGHIIETYGKLLDALDRGDPRAGTVKYLGPVKRPEFAAPLEAIERTIPPGVDPDVPRGGRRLCMFDMTARLPVLVDTFDAAGTEVEYYCYDRLQCGVKLDDDDFNPDKLWPAPTAKAGK
jgi:hypothetical protein